MTTERLDTLQRMADTDLTIADGEQDIRGRTVKDAAGEDLGKVDDLLLDDRESKVRFMEVATGGFLGLGKAKSLIPVEAILSITEDEVWISHTRSQVEGAPDYDPNLMADPHFTGVYGYYGYPPYWAGGHPMV